MNCASSSNLPPFFNNKFKPNIDGVDANDNTVIIFVKKSVRMLSMTRTSHQLAYPTILPKNTTTIRNSKLMFSLISIPMKTYEKITYHDFN